MSAKNKVKLSIAGCEIMVASEESEEYIKETALKVDEYINRQMEYTPNMSTTLAAIFAALEFCDEATREKQAADNLRGQIKEYSDDAAKAREEARRAKNDEESALRELQSIKTLEGLKAFQEQQKKNGR